MLVEHHLLLTDVATRRDLDDPATIEMVARRVQTTERLAILRSLSEADSIATGVLAWGPWKAQLLEQLTNKVADLLNGAQVDDLVRSGFPTAVQRTLIDDRRVQVLAEDERITVACPDRVGVVYRVAGALALHGLDIVEANINSEAGMVVDEFRVRAPASGIIAWDRVTGDVASALDGKLAIEARLSERVRRERQRHHAGLRRLPSSVQFDNDASGDATVIEVGGPDSTGLLFRLTTGAGRPGSRREDREDPHDRRRRGRHVLRRRAERPEAPGSRPPGRDPSGPAVRARSGLTPPGPRERGGSVGAMDGDPLDPEPVSDPTLTDSDLLRWSESLAGIARTGLAFTESLYERERYEEVLHVAAEIHARALRRPPGESLEATVEQWMKQVEAGPAGYVTPKVAIGAVVGNDAGELLLLQRSDSGIWLYPTGWADIGYSASEVAVKEVREETGIEIEVVRLLAVFDGFRLGFTPDPAVLADLPVPGGGRRAARPSPRDARCRLVLPRCAAAPGRGDRSLG